MALLGLGPMGTAVAGFVLNLAIAWLFPQKVKGPRQENLKAQTSKYGEPIARCHVGAARVGAAVIWLKNNKVDEHKKEKRGSALGAIQITYSYSADFAVAFMWNGPVTGIARLWADKKIVMDNSAESLDAAIAGSGKAIGDAKGATFRIYLGTETQTPDPDIEAAIGVGGVPAWPGLVYVVVKNFPLEDFGIRVPNFEAEIVNGNASTSWVNPTGDLAFSGTVIDIANSRHVSADGTTLAMNRIPVGDLLWTAALAAGPSAVHITVRGDVAVMRSEYDNPTGGVIWFYDGMTGALLQTLELPATAYFDASYPGKFSDVSVEGNTWLFLEVFGLAVIAFRNSGSGWQYVWQNTLEGGQLWNTISAGPEYIYAIRTTGNLRRIKWTITEIADQSDASASFSGTLQAACYDVDSDSVIVLTSTHLYTVDPNLSTILKTKVLGYAVAGTSKRMQSADGRVAVKASNNDFYEYRISDLVEVLHVVAADTTWDGKTTAYAQWEMAPQWGMALVASGPSATSRYWFLPRIARSPIPLADVIEAECGYVGIVPDVSAITKEIKGYTAREATSPRGVIEDLARTQFFDFAQMGTVLTFVNRSPTAVASISINDMGSGDEDKAENPRLVEEEYSDLRELPTRIEISYPAYGADYRAGTQTIQSPDGLDDTKNIIAFNTPLVMTDDQAAQSADILYNETREALSTFKTKLSSKYLNRTPADVVNLPLDDVRTTTAVITKIEGENILETELHLRTMDYTSNAVGSPTPSDGEASLLGKADLIFLPIDGHLLRAADNNDSFYCGVSRIESGTFSSGIVYRSTNGGGEYSPWETFVSELVRGIAKSALPDRPHPESWDRASSLIVAVGNSRSLPASVSEATLLSDTSLNAFAIRSGTDWEYVRAATIVDNADGTWTLSTFLRGRKGTDFAMAGHAIGDEVLYLDANDLSRPDQGDKDLDRIYVPVASSTAFNSALGRHFTNLSRGLRPWAPVNIGVTRDGSGNITGIFNRRDRLGQDWPDDGPEDPPMSESVEDYDVVIYDTGVAVRTIPVASETFSYSAADQTADFGSPQAEGTLDIGIAQISSTFGDGIERQATV